MILEKTIRKKRISPFYLEIWAYVFCSQIIYIATSIILGLCFHSLLVGLSFFLLGIFLTVLIFLLSTSSKSTLLHNFVLPIHLLQDKKCHRFKVCDIVIVDYFFSYIEEYRTEDGFVFSYTYIFFTEPFIRVGKFVALPVGTQTILDQPLHIYLQKIHWIYWLHKRGKDDWERELNQDYLIPQQKTKKYNKSKSDSFYLYITFDKRKELNRLFELVNPPEFRITKYEKSEVFISIDPIPGKEYPPEALECMEKINAMYP